MGRSSLVLWVARVWGAVILAFVLLLAIPGIFGEDVGEGLRDAREVLVFFCFPVCTVVGLAIAYKWAGLGGLIATTGAAGLFVLRPDLISSPWFTLAIAPPGVLYLVHWAMTRSVGNDVPD